MQLPNGFQARAPRDDEVSAIAAVVAASQRAVRGEVDVTESDIAAEWSRPSFDRETDAVVIVADGDVVAYAHQHGERALVAVAPHVTGRGIGTALLEWTEVAARRRGATSVGQTLSEREHGAQQLLARKGYEVRWETWVFHLPLNDLGVPDAPPTGINVRTIHRPADDRTVYDVINTAFSEWPDREPPLPFEDWRAAYLDHGGADSGVVLLADDGAEVVGVALCMQVGDVGWVEQLAVARSHRGRGIGRHLLASAFTEFRRHGLQTAAVSTESRTGARDLYERAGMRVVRTYHRLSKSLSVVSEDTATE